MAVFIRCSELVSEGDGEMPVLVLLWYTPLRAPRFCQRVAVSHPDPISGFLTREQLGGVCAVWFVGFFSATGASEIAVVFLSLGVQVNQPN